MRVVQEWEKFVNKIDKSDIRFEMEAEDLADVYKDLDEYAKAIEVLTAIRDAQDNEFKIEMIQDKIDEIKLNLDN